MSYGLDLVRLPAGKDAEAAYAEYQQERERQYEAGTTAADRLGPVDPEKEERKERVAAALIAINADLERFERNYAAIAQEDAIPEAEARRLYRDVELNDHRHSIQITLFDDEAGISFSYTGRGEACAKALRKLWECLEVLEAEGGYRTYDPQVAKVLDLGSDFETVRSTFCRA